MINQPVCLVFIPLLLLVLTEDVTFHQLQRQRS